VCRLLHELGRGQRVRPDRRRDRANRQGHRKAHFKLGSFCRN
jgi:hypothetical protein